MRVRMGLHTGEPQRHEDGYIGIDVHRAARIAATASGGQIVLSEADPHRWSASLGAGRSLRDLGWHRLKDLDEPEHLYDVVAAGPGRRASRRCAASARAPTCRRPPRALIGRAGELAELPAADRRPTAPGW